MLSLLNLKSTNEGPVHVCVICIRYSYFWSVKCFDWSSYGMDLLGIKCHGWEISFKGERAETFVKGLSTIEVIMFW